MMRKGRSEIKAGNTRSSSEGSLNKYKSIELKRDDRLLGTSFLAMIMPFIFQYFALHMIEIVDAVMVGHFLTSSDLIALGIGFKAERLADLPFVFFGTGGAILVGNLLGKGERKKANEVYSFCLLASVVLSCLLAFFAVFAEPVANLIIGGVSPEAAESARTYIFWIISMSPLIVIFCCVCRFIRVEGYAKTVSAFYITANILNAFFDFVFLKFFSMGIEAVALGSLIGYFLSSLILLFYFRSPEKMLSFVNPFSIDYKTALDAIRAGTPASLRILADTAISGMRYSMAAAMFGMPGLLIGTLYTEITSVINLFLDGIFTAFSVYVSILNGERDYRGLKAIIRFSMLLTLGICGTIISSLLLYPSVVFRIFGINEFQDMIPMLRVCMPVILIDMFIYFWGQYYEAIMLTSFSLLTECFNVHAVLFITLLMLRTFGIHVDYSVCITLDGAVSMLIMIIWHLKNHSLRNWSLLPDEESEALYITVSATDNLASQISKKVQAFCEEHSVSKKLSILIALATEEMVCVQMSVKEDVGGSMDIIVRIGQNELLLIMRDKGRPFDIVAYAGHEQAPGSSIDVLKKIATEISYTRAMQMNNTIIKFLNEGE